MGSIRRSAELDAFNKVMLGREKRIIEMKQEVTPPNSCNT